jgi:hypothetical protein
LGFAVARLSRNQRRAIAAIALLVIVVGPKACSYATFRPVHVAPSHPEVREDLTARSRYLAHRVAGLTTGEMPWYLPDQFKGEWLAVTYSMTAMAMANLAFLYPDRVGEARETIDRLAQAMLGEDVRGFDSALWGEDPLSSLDGPNGHIGYLGHLEIVLLAQQYVGGSSAHAKLTRDVAQAMHRRMTASPSLHAETYPGQTFVADNTVVVACLALAQRLYPDDHLDLSEAWVRRVQTDYLDPGTGLMVFRIAGDGAVIEASRGSGVAWGVFYLSYASRSFAEQQHRQLKAVMGSRVLGLVHGVREYPNGDERGGDVDSGPLVFGLSPSGTGFAIAGATLAGDEVGKLELLRTAELVGTTLGTGAGRRYVLSPLVGDAILLAMRTVTAWDEPLR